jgi:hypothetical protein
MPWQDAPLIEDPQQQQQQGWRAAPPVDQGSPTPSPMTTSAPPGPSAPGGAGQGPQQWLDPSGTGQVWKPSGNALWDLLSRPVAKTEDMLPAARDYGSAILDAATMGTADKLQSLATGEDVNAIRARTAAAHADLGAMDYAATTLGYAAGPGQILGPLARGAVGAVAPSVAAVGAPALARIAGGVGAGALESGAASGLGTAGHGGSASDIAKNTALGTVLGAGTGGLSAGLGALTGGEAGAAAAAGGPTPKGPSDADLFKTAKQGFDDAGLHLFDNADIRQGMMNARNEIAQQPNRVTRLGGGAFKQVEDLENQATGRGAMSGEDLNDYIKALHNNQTGDAVPVAGQIAQKHLNLILDQAQPISKQPIGSAGAAIDAANSAFGRASDLERLGTDPSELTKAKIAKTQSFYQPGMPQANPVIAQSLSNLQSAMDPKFNWYNMRHIVGPVALPLIGAGLQGAEGYFNPAEGQSRGITALSEAARGGIEGAGVYGYLKSAAKARPGAAFDAARYAIGTGGQPLTTATGGVSDALSNLLFGRGATNQWPY